MKICIHPKRSDLFPGTLMFKQQSTKVLQYAQGETVSGRGGGEEKNKKPKQQTKTTKTTKTPKQKIKPKQKSQPPPTTTFNSKVSCSSSLLNFLKQNNIISASTISKVPNNAFYSVILYLKKAFDLNKTPKFYILVPPKEHKNRATFPPFPQTSHCFRQSLFPHTSEIKIMNLNSRRLKSLRFLGRRLGFTFVLLKIHG